MRESVALAQGAGRQRPPFLGPGVPEQARAVGRAPVFEGGHVVLWPAGTAVAGVFGIGIGGVHRDRLQHQDADPRHARARAGPHIVQARHHHAGVQGSQWRQRVVHRPGGQDQFPARRHHGGQIGQLERRAARQHHVLTRHRQPQARLDKQPLDGAGFVAFHTHRDAQATHHPRGERLTALGDVSRLPALAPLQRRRGQRARGKQVGPPQPVGRREGGIFGREGDHALARQRFGDVFDAHVGPPEMLKGMGTGSTPCITASRLRESLSWRPLSWPQASSRRFFLRAWRSSRPRARVVSARSALMAAPRPVRPPPPAQGAAPGSPPRAA
ncbi:hypothetical protein FQZ97_849400 [compost metagenome]